MTRAERRRNDRKEQKNKTKTYTFTKDQLDQIIQKGVDVQIGKIKQEITDAAVNQAMLLTLVLPMEVLMDHYWEKSYRKKLPGFVNYVLDYYKKWQDGEIDIEDLKKDLWEYGGVRFEENTVALS